MKKIYKIILIFEIILILLFLGGYGIYEYNYEKENPQIKNNCEVPIEIEITGNMISLSKSQLLNS